MSRVTRHASRKHNRHFPFTVGGLFCAGAHRAGGGCEESGKDVKGTCVLFEIPHVANASFGMTMSRQWGERSWARRREQNKRQVFAPRPP